MIDPPMEEIVGNKVRSAGQRPVGGQKVSLTLASDIQQGNRRS
jgi:hypothetical protein